MCFAGLSLARVDRWAAQPRPNSERDDARRTLLHCPWACGSVCWSPFVDERCTDSRGAVREVEALDQAIQIHGGNGFALEYGLADLWFIARVHKSAPVSREMVLNHVAQHTLGLPKSY